MPFYEYKCQACQHQFEVMQKMNDTPLKTCPNCHKDSLSKLISSTGFQLKGSGWYVTDFKNKGKPAEKPTSTQEPPKEDAKTPEGDKTPTKSDPPPKTDKSGD